MLLPPRSKHHNNQCGIDQLSFISKRTVCSGKFANHKGSIVDYKYHISTEISKTNEEVIPPPITVRDSGLNFSSANHFLGHSPIQVAKARGLTSLVRKTLRTLKTVNIKRSQDLLWITHSLCIANSEIDYWSLQCITQMDGRCWTVAATLERPQLPRLTDIDQFGGLKCTMLRRPARILSAVFASEGRWKDRNSVNITPIHLTFNCGQIAAHSSSCKRCRSRVPSNKSMFRHCRCKNSMFFIDDKLIFYQKKFFRLKNNLSKSRKSQIRAMFLSICQPETLKR